MTSNDGHGFTIREVAQTDSTNDDALALLGTTENDGGIVLVTDFQRAGRARRARTWLAPPGSSLLCTTILPRPIPNDALYAVTLWTALGVADGIEAATGIRVGLQWPNDLLMDGRKCCGILCVSRISGDGAWVACGTGINVNRPENDPALAAIVPAPAFLSDAAPAVERANVLNAILRAYASRLDDFATPERIARAWELRAGLAGTRYRLLIDGESEPFEGIAKRLDRDGSLIVEHDGSERRISLADARVLRD